MAKPGFGSAGSGVIEVRDPDDGSTVGEVRATSPDGLDRALTRGVAALRSQRQPAHERARILASVADRVAAEAEPHALLIASEGVKTIREARREVLRCVETLRLSASEAKRIGGSVISFDQASTGVGRSGWWALRPAGLVAAITPFNDPLNLVAHKVGPAFALGAPTIVKPHPQTPLSALRLVQHFHEAGAPEPTVQIVFGGAQLGEALVADPRVRTVSFTGGGAAGRAIAARAGIKRLLLELGGVSVVAVAGDANLEHAAAAIHSGAFWAAGQNCIHSQRIIAETGVIDELRDRLLGLAARVRLGSKRADTTDMGPLVDVAAAERVAGLVEAARAGGARILCGGAREHNRFTPTWIDALPRHHALESTEIFGPVATLEPVAGRAELLERMAAAEAAIHAAIFTTTLDSAMDAFEMANAAALIVNDSTDFRVDAMPFGGGGSAGLGREGVVDAVEAMAEKKLFVLNRATR
jgi:glyceraldehyde-3-phosphate dehydrogenase (NADP+)